jgi:hypothetical protein
MSIWADCEEFDALPFMGFPVKPSVKDNVVTFEFPKGYAPNGSQTQDVADRLARILEGEVLEVTDKLVRVSFDETNLGTIIYSHYIENRFE